MIQFNNNGTVDRSKYRNSLGTYDHGVTELADTVDALLRERGHLIDNTIETFDEIQQDAVRYQWIRQHTSGKQDQRGRQEFVLPDPYPLTNIMRGSVAEHLDAAIDAAISKE